MQVGVDTGFFFALKEQNPDAVKVWNENEIVTSVIVLYEMQKKLLRGNFPKWPKIIDDMKKSMLLVPLTTEVALKAGHIAHSTGMPGLDSLILASLIEAECTEIYSSDPHFSLYKKKGIKIINI